MVLLPPGTKVRLHRPVISGGAGGAMANQLTLSPPGGAYYAHHITTGTPGFLKLSTALETNQVIRKMRKSLF